MYSLLLVCGIFCTFCCTLALLCMMPVPDVQIYIILFATVPLITELTHVSPSQMARSELEFRPRSTQFTPSVTRNVLRVKWKHWRGPPPVILPTSPVNITRNEVTLLPLSHEQLTGYHVAGINFRSHKQDAPTTKATRYAPT